MPDTLLLRCVAAMQARAGAGPDANGHAKLPAIWQLIKSNYFSHRKRKRQDEDEIMVCHCPPPWRGGDGCGPNCINRMLCIECTQVGMLTAPALASLQSSNRHGIQLAVAWA